MTVRHQPSAAVIAVACLVLSVGIWAAAFCAAPTREAGPATPTATLVVVVLATPTVDPTLRALLAGPATTRTPTPRELLLTTPRPSSTLAAPTATETPTPVPTTATPAETPALRPMVQRG